MSRSPFPRIALSLVGAIIAVTAVVSAVLRVDALRGFSSCTWTVAFGWTVPVVAAVIIGAVAWVLLRTGEADADETVGGMSCRCSECGEPVIDNWRLCPYCGVMVAGSPKTAPPEDAA